MSTFTIHIAKKTAEGKAIANKPQCGKAYEYATGKHPYVELTKAFCDDIRRGRRVCKNCLATAIQQGRVSKDLALMANQG
jgi:hypothetical protein